MLIIEMEMPKNCCECDLRQDNFDRGEQYCPFTGVECLSIGRQAKCPIKGVLPDEHVDLIDRDKLKRAFCNHCDGRDTMNGEPNCTEPCFDLGLIDCMPVIIAAERKDDGK